MNCKNCSLELKEDALFCPVCGTKVEKEQAPKADFCSACGRCIGEEDVFCPGCGTRLKEEKKLCGGCGAELKKDEAFCHLCGTRAQQTAVVALENKEEAPKKVSYKDAVMSMVFGFLAGYVGELAMIPFVFPFFLAGAIVLMVFSKKYRDRYLSEAGKHCGFTVAGNVGRISAIPAVIFFALYGFVLTMLIITGEFANGM